nr:cathepsin L-like proteinase [Nicotiana tomentosiformis]
MADVEFSLKDSGILLPNVRKQGRMNVCYAYSTGEAVSALFAKEFSEPPVELSIQQIADLLPINFNYENRLHRTDEVGCYFGSHVDALLYARDFGLFKECDYPRRGSRNKDDIPPIPDKPRYRIGHANRVCIAGDPHRKDSERLVTAEEINRVLTYQPMVGAIDIYDSFANFKGDGVYTGCIAEETDQGGHSILIIGWGIKDGIEYYLIKNSWSENWGDGGYAKVRRDLVYRLAYPEGVDKVGNHYEDYNSSEAKKEKGKDAPNISRTKKEKGKSAPSSGGSRKRKEKAR